MFKVNSFAILPLPCAVATMFFILVASPLMAGDSHKAQPAGPRTIVTDGFVNDQPLFLTEAGTLDPMDLARLAWNGYVKQKADPWGLTPDGQPLLRFSFDCRALPWPSIKHNAVDALDNNGRGVGAHALLHAMFGKEKDNDASEAGQMAYLEWCSDPSTGLACMTEQTTLSAPLPEGEMANNLMLLYENTGEKKWRDWAAKLVNTLRLYTVVSNVPGIGEVASYPVGDIQIGDAPQTSVKDPINPGWYPPGWNIIAFSRWYEITGDKSSLEFATALANRYCHTATPNGDDGCLRPDGSFGSGNQKNGLASHMHGHTHTLPGLLHLGGQLIKSGDRQTGLKMIHQADATFDWLYDPARNPDAGSLTGWLAEWLIVQLGWDHKSDCEGCTMGDVVQTAAMLGASSRLDSGLAGYSRYYDRAEQIFRNQLVGQTFQLTPQYLALVHDCIAKSVAKESRAKPLAPAAAMNTVTSEGNQKISLGELDLSPGAYYVRVRNDSPSPFMVDNIEVASGGHSQRYPAATWMGCVQSDVSAGSLSKVAPGSWHGLRYNLCGNEITSGLSDGTPISARIPIRVDADGQYSLKASIVKSRDLGIIDVAIDDQKIGTLDCYQPAESTAWELATAGTSQLSAGWHLVTLTWTAGKKNSNSAGTEVFCDYVTLDDGKSKYDLEDYCQDSIYSSTDKKAYGWTLNNDSSCQPGFTSPALSYFNNGGTGLSVRIPFIVATAGKYAISVNAIKSKCGANGVASASLCSFSQSADPNAQNIEAQKINAQEIETRYQTVVKTGQRMIGQQLGLCGFPDWVNQLPSDLDPELPGIHMQSCCADATIRGAHAIWSETVTGTPEETRVNMAFDRKSDLVDVVSCLPYRGELDLSVKTAKRILVRIPEWSPKDQVKLFVNQRPAPVKWDGDYVVFPRTRNGQQLCVTYPVRLATIKETVGSLSGIQYTEKWRGNTLVDISPRGKWIPMFEHPDMNTDSVPKKPLTAPDGSTVCLTQ